jgi:proteasome beta subunit
VSDKLLPYINNPFGSLARENFERSDEIRKKVDALKYHGTTTCAMIANDGVVLCTDTRVTAGYLFIAHRRGKKMYMIDKHVGVTIAGTVADAQSLIDTLKYYSNLYKLEKSEPIPVRSIARIAANIFFGNRAYPMIADFLICGVDPQEGPTIYSVDFFGTETKETFVSTGSGSPVAYGILEDEYRKDMSVKEVIPIAIKAVNAAIKRNAGTGDGFDVAIVTADAGYRELTRDEKSQYLAAIAAATTIPRS